MSSFAVYSKFMTHFFQIGVGLMLLQQLSGSSGVMFYVGSVFNKGGKTNSVPHVMIMYLSSFVSNRSLFLLTGFPSDIGSMILAAIMVCLCT